MAETAFRFINSLIMWAIGIDPHDEHIQHD